MKRDPIDKLFEDKLRDYQELPDDKVWKAIETSLDKKRKSRKVIPIWWKLGGVAAVLALLLLLFNPFASGEDTLPAVTDTEETRSPVEQADSPVVNSPDSLTDSDTADTPAKGIEETPADTGVAQRPSSEADPGQEAPGAVNKGIPPATEQLAASETRGENTSERGDTDNPATVKDPAVIAAENDPAVADNQRAQPGEKERPAVPTQQDIDREAGETRETQLAQTDPEEDANKKQSIYDAIVEAAEEEEALAESEASRWAVGPKVAPVYFNAFGTGSPIHSSFVASSKTGNVNFSYGLSVSYDISPKLSIRSGVHKVDYGYDTNDVSFSPSFSISPGQRITTIDYAISSRNLVVRTSAQAKVVQDAMSAEVAGEFPTRDGRMVQQFGYVEVPLELNFALLDSKFGVNIIGGMSSLFLVDNSVTLESNGSATEMGEANNLNPLNFSTNIGLGLQYEVSPKIQLSLEPVFKYQLNTFSESAGNFNPYSVGVYSGFNFRF